MKTLSPLICYRNDSTVLYNKKIQKRPHIYSQKSMYKDDMKIFAENEKELKSLILLEYAAKMKEWNLESKNVPCL